MIRDLIGLNTPQPKIALIGRIRRFAPQSVAFIAILRPDRRSGVSEWCLSLLKNFTPLFTGHWQRLWPLVVTRQLPFLGRRGIKSARFRPILGGFRWRTELVPRALLNPPAAPFAAMDHSIVVCRDGTSRTILLAGELRDVAEALTLGTAPEWIHLIPLGEFAARDGRGPYRLEDPARVIATTREYHEGREIPIDYNHQMEAEAYGEEAPASGWISELQAREDGIWGKVTWTSRAARALEDREYRYISPVFAFSKTTGEVLALLRAGLTNTPALAELAAINSTTHHEEIHMSDRTAELQRVAAILSLPMTADDAAICGRATALVESERVTRGQLTLLRQKAGVGETATVEEIVTAIHRTAPVDPARYIPIEQHTAVMTELSSLRSKEVERAVNGAIAAGKVVPANKQWALDYATKDLAGFEAFAAQQQPVLQAGRSVDPHKQGGEKSTLTDDELSICSQLGLTPEQFGGKAAKATA